MADAGALYGLIGAVVGAVLGAVAMVSVPVLERWWRRSDTEAERTRQAVDTEIARLTSLRVTGRHWIDVLKRAEQDLAAGRAPALDTFDAEIKAVGVPAIDAHYLHPLFAQHSPATQQAAAHAFDRLEEATQLLRRDLLGSVAQGVSRERALEASLAVARAEHARDQLNEQLLDQIARIQQTLPDPPSSITVSQPGSPGRARTNRGH
ncbi:hypothetical protein [Streptomyces sp. AC627_RSS907]|uniref:hypothetical protein n=1 Tax=Streptomyces sp. AC627_RSS907 TaxID=2823684 RepID=UPI001C216597|nr:hypothetical protein [Streptomyces sp. AC627_RSS907]